MQWPRVVCILSLVLISASCKQKKEAESTREIVPEAIFFDYQVRGDEGSDSVSVLLNYREFNEFGYGLKLDTPSKVQLDDEIIRGVTLKIPGTYYEVQKAAPGFAGTHRLKYTDIDKNEYVEQFNYTPLVLVTPVPGSLPVADLELTLEGFAKGDIIHILLTDTAYASEGIERQETVKNGRILITAEELAELEPGPVQLELVKENIRAISTEGRIRGKLAVIYGLKREFILTRNPD
jgi:hypothetical protein